MGLSLLPKKIDHLSKSADSDARSTGPHFIDHSTDMLAKRIAIRHAVDHECSERALSVHEREIAGPNVPFDFESILLYRGCEGLSVLWHRDHKERITCRQAIAQKS